jgi:hypothetical protein
MKKLLIAGALGLLGVFLYLSALGSAWVMGSRYEAARLRSPTGAFEAVVIETNGGATTSFGYEIHVVKAGSDPSDAASQAALLYGAVTSVHYGVILEWTAANSLTIGYLRAHSTRVDRPNVRIGDQDVVVQLQSGRSDTTALRNGVLYICCPEPIVRGAIQ